MIFCFQRIENGLLKTFYQWKLGIQPQISDLLRFLGVWIFSPKWKTSAMSVWSNFQVLGKKTSIDLLVPNDTEQTIEDISSVETG